MPAANEVRLRHTPLFLRQPNYTGSGVDFSIDKYGNKVEIIIVQVNEDPVDQNTLPPEDRIPDCLEGFPVQIIIEGPVKLLIELLEDADAEGANERN